MAVEWAKKMRAASRHDARAFFSEHAEFDVQSSEFALEHAGFLMDGEELAAALHVLERAPNSRTDDRILLAMAEILASLGRPQEAVALLEPVAHPRQRSHAVWSAFMKAAKATKDRKIVFHVMDRWIAAVPRRAAFVMTKVGKWLHSLRGYDDAVVYFENSLELDGEDATTRLCYAETLLALDRIGEAKAQLAKIRPMSTSEKAFVARLEARIAKQTEQMATGK
jgi:predicted Zn-dependent protease